MTISFNQVPANIRVPFVRIEVNAGQAPYQSISRLLLFASMTAAGVAEPNTPIWVTGNEDGLFGSGSMAAAMYNIARANGPFQEIWVCPLADVAGSSKAVGSVTISTTATPVTVPGTIVLYIGGLRITVPVNTLMSATAIAAALAAAVNSCPYMQVTATVAANVVTLTANNAGTLGDTILIATQLAQDDGLMADMLCTIVPMSNGAGDPDLQAAIANLGDDQWDFMCSPWTDSAHLDEIDNYLATRWAPMSQKYGLHISAKAGSAGSILAFTIARNSQYTHLMPMFNGPNPIYLVAAATACQAAVHLQAPPELSRPMQDVTLVGIRPPKSSGDYWSVVQRQSFYYAGASGYVVQSGAVVIDRLVSTYQRDGFGNVDQAWLDINTMAQLMYGLRAIASYITETYPRAALVKSNPNNIQNFVVAQDIANAMIHAYKGLEAIGVFQQSDLFAQLLIVEYDATDPSRLNTYLPLEAVNALRIMAVNATSYLQYPTN